MIGLRRVAPLVAGVVAAAGLTAGCASHAPAATAPARSRAPLPSPATLVHDGVIFRPQRTPPQGATTSGSAVSLYVFAQDNEHAICAAIRPSARLVSENDHSVVVALFVYRYPPRQHGTVSCAYEFAGGTEPPQAGPTVRLREPLGTRTLVDDDTGRRIALIPNRPPPAPGFLPAGYRFLHADPFDRTTLFGIRQYQRGQATIEIYQHSASAEESHGTVRDHATINGRRATLSESSFDRCWSWTTPAAFGFDVCSLARDHRYLSPAELKRIAVSLR